ncbi:MAG: hypothetical protein JKY67_22600 [Pseudomonadales bacterium]|nr:hypothetical protein [Pseudomonadales bacterium]
MGFKVEGFKQLQASLNKLDVKTGVATLRKAGRKAMKTVEAYQKQHVHVVTGDTRDAITISARKGGRKAKSRVVLISVGPTKKSSGRGNSKRQLTGVNQKAIAQEFGNVKTKVDPFIRPSLDVNQQQVINTLTAEFRKLFEAIK